jgi:hypothetical protein
MQKDVRNSDERVDEGGCKMVLMKQKGEKRSGIEIVK